MQKHSSGEIDCPLVKKWRVELSKDLFKKKNIDKAWNFIPVFNNINVVVGDTQDSEQPVLLTLTDPDER